MAKNPPRSLCARFRTLDHKHVPFGLVFSPLLSFVSLSDDGRRSNFRAIYQRKVYSASPSAKVRRDRSKKREIKEYCTVRTAVVTHLSLVNDPLCLVFDRN